MVIDVDEPDIGSRLPLGGREQEFVRAGFDTVEDLVAVCDPQCRIQLVNRAMEEFAGLQRCGRPPESWLDYGDFRDADGTRLALNASPLSRALRGETVLDMELVVETRPGGRRLMVARAERLLNVHGDVIGAIVVCRDVTEHRDAQAELAFHMLHDPLTRLPVRALFVDHVKRALADARRHRWGTAVLAINLDAFTDTANRLGDDAGEVILGEVAQRLQDHADRHDIASRRLETLSRLGGDQFLLLCENIASERAAELVADRVDAALRAPMTVRGEIITVTAGIGITLTRDHRHGAEPLILEAETAMHRAKQRGPGHHETFAPEMRTRLHARLETQDALRQALAMGQFRVAYQPKVSLVTDQMTGVEALLRWRHPQRGVIPPLDFIALAEDTGLIVAIGAWVLEQVCRDARRWRTSLPGGLPLKVAVNVSPRQFEPGLAEAFGSIIAGAGIDPSTLCLEVTEGMVMHDAAFAATTLRELKALGLAISIDDFGTGFSSLAYLKRFPLDELKIDKSFIDGVGSDPEDTAIVAAVMGMAHALDLHVVAEGVETSHQVARLRTLGCDEAQGYYFARPGSAADIDERLRLGAAGGPPRQESAGGHARARRRPRRVLVVDDTADVRQLARSSLAAAGFEVQEARTGEEAIIIARRFRPDCVVLDVHLPGMSGLDVCRILRIDPVSRDTTIVILTSDAEPAEKVEAFSLKADDYMVKPFSPRDLVGRVTAAMRRRAGTREEAAR